MRIHGIIPDHVLRKMKPEDRKPLGKAGMTAAEAAGKYEARRERELHDQIASWLRQHGITFRHDRMDKKTTGTLGWPDFSFAVRGRAVALEVKMPSGGLLSADQVRCIAGLQRDGWLVRVVYSLDEAISIVKWAEAL